MVVVFIALSCGASYFAADLKWKRKLLGAELAVFDAEKCEVVLKEPGDIFKEVYQQLQLRQFNAIKEALTEKAAQERLESEEKKEHKEKGGGLREAEAANY